MVLVAGLACSANDDIPAPLVSTVFPNHATPGSLVVVAGDYFCQRPNTGIEDPTCAAIGSVHFGIAPGTTTTWADTSITVEVPLGVTGGVDVSVTAAGRTSNTVAFTAE